MKSTLIAGILLLFSFAGMAQDQVKLMNSKEVIECRILKVTRMSMKVLLKNNVEKRMAFDVVDSVYSANDTVRKAMMEYSYLKKKLKDFPLSGPKLLITKMAEIIDTNKVVDKKTAMVLNNTQVSQELLKQRMVKGGNALGRSANCIFGGIILTVTGALVLQKQPDAAYVVMGLGGLFNLIGIGNIATAGNYLNGTKAYSLEAGSLQNGIGVAVRF